MLKKIIILIIFNTLYAQHINNETGWEFYSSPIQSFYIFDEIQIDGEPAFGDGWAPSTTINSDCINNPFSCDVVGAFLNGICVGWVYADAEGYTTLPIMGTNSTNPPNNTDGYCVEGDIPEIKIYDSSTGSILDIISGDLIPGWSENFVHQIQNISFANNGITNNITGWNYFQSSNQAFYIFENIVYGDGIDISSDVIGAFKNDLCVGWINIDPEGFSSIPVMGIEENLYPNYMEEGEIPEFKIYDYSEGEYYIVQTQAINLSGWESNGYFITYGDVQTLPETIFGCTDLEACNFEVTATDDDGSCYYCYEDNCEQYPSLLYDCVGDCIVEVDCFGECGGSALEDDCGICNGDNDCFVASLSFGNFDPLGTVEILYDFGGPVAGFQFDVTNLELTSASGGAASDVGMTVSVGDDTVLGFSLTNIEIPAGNGLLTILSFNSVTDGSTELSMGWSGAVTDASGNIYEVTVSGSIDHGNPDCLGVYYGDAFIDDCGQCVSGGTNPDDCLSSNLEIPNELYLSQNYPNPFNPTSDVKYGISEAGQVNISLYDLGGRKILDLVDSYHSPGYYSLRISSKNLNSGIYILKLTTASKNKVKKVTIIK